jgi:hypothetical protein
VFYHAASVADAEGLCREIVEDIDGTREAGGSVEAVLFASLVGEDRAIRRIHYH